MRLVVALLLQTLPAQHFPPVAQPGTTIAFAAEGAAICHVTTGRAESLSRQEELTADSIRRDDELPTWDHLACLRAALAAAGAFSHASLDMPAGESWTQGAAQAAVHVLERRPGDTAAATVLALVALDDPRIADNATQRAEIFRAVGAGVRSPAALRACAELGWRQRDTTTTRHCATLALSAGVDSTWHLVQLARLAFAAAGMRDFVAATSAAHDSAARQEIDWQLQWFLTPLEEGQWHALADSARATWVRDRLMARDVRDDRPAGARLAEHFKRLDYVESHFRLEVPARIAAGLRTGPSTEEGPPGCGNVLSCQEPGAAWAEQWREYDRWQTDFDDRGVVWMRYGPPDRLVPWGCHVAMCGVEREAWLYNIDGQHLLLSFENEAFDGSVQPARLVAGVLGSYFCDIDAERCNLTSLSQGSAYAAAARITWAPVLPSSSMVHPEDIERIRTQDRIAISDATTSDDNSIRALAHIDGDARLLRYWDPATGALRALVVYALTRSDLDTSVISLHVAQWDSRSDERHDTTVTRREQIGGLADRDLIGVVGLSSSAGVKSWSVTAVQGARRGRSFDDNAAAIGSGPVAISDLILGVESQQTSTPIGPSTVPLAPLGHVARDELLHLYYQLRSDSARSVRVALAFYRAPPAGSAAPLGNALLSETSTTRLVPGIAPHEQTIDLSRLAPDRYVVEVTVASARGDTLTRRRTEITVTK